MLSHLLSRWRNAACTETPAGARRVKRASPFSGDGEDGGGGVVGGLQSGSKQNSFRSTPIRLMHKQDTAHAVHHRYATALKAAPAGVPATPTAAAAGTATAPWGSREHAGAWRPCYPSKRMARHPSC